MTLIEQLEIVQELTIKGDLKIHGIDEHLILTIIQKLKAAERLREDVGKTEKYLKKYFDEELPMKRHVFNMTSESLVTHDKSISN